MLADSALRSEKLSGRGSDSAPVSISGAGMGLRTPHLPTILNQQPDVAWFEILSDNWLQPRRVERQMLDAVVERYPLVMHGVGLSLGGQDPLDLDYLRRIQQLKASVNAQWVSEHCSFSQHQGIYVPDLLPLPFTDEAVMHISERIRTVQDVFGESILLENVSSYVDCQFSHLSEAQFMASIAAESGCDLLLDVNNCYVSAINATAPDERDEAVLTSYVLDYFDTIPNDRVRQIHLAGHEQRDGYVLDTHGGPVCDAVWRLYEAYVTQYGNPPCMIEWDNNVPSFEVVFAEHQLIESVMSRATQGAV
ncbi:MAG: DUF692 domain-containing protein [Pseudomonadota bacterium]